MPARRSRGILGEGREQARSGASSRASYDRGRRSHSQVVSPPVAKTNVAACGRARWKIKNESFNVPKNHRYELERNFGHGEKYLAMTLAALNMLAFAWRAVLDLLKPPWRRAREAAEKRMSFFAYRASPTSFVVFPAWSDLLEALATFTIPPGLLATPKIE